jgi:hypothetical protein
MDLLALDQVLGNIDFLKEQKCASFRGIVRDVPVDQNIFDFSKFGKIFFDCDLISFLVQSTEKNFSFDLVALLLGYFLFVHQFFHSELNFGLKFSTQIFNKNSEI